MFLPEPAFLRYVSANCATSVEYCKINSMMYSLAHFKAIKGVGAVFIKRVDERDLRTGICNVHGSNGLLTIERNTDLIKGL